MLSTWWVVVTGLCSQRDFFIYSNIITLRSAVALGSITQTISNSFPRLLVLVPWNCSSALCKRRGEKKNIGRRGEKEGIRETILFRCFWKGRVTKSETTLLLNNVSCLSLPLRGNNVAAAKHFPTKRHSIFPPSLPFFYQTTVALFLYPPSRNV